MVVGARPAGRREHRVQRARRAACLLRSHMQLAARHNGHIGGHIAIWSHPHPAPQCHAPHCRPPGDKLLSKLVNVLINTPPVWEVMKYFAKAAIKNTARRKGVDWEGYARQLLSDQEVRG